MYTDGFPTNFLCFSSTEFGAIAVLLPLVRTKGRGVYVSMHVRRVIQGELCHNSGPIG